MFGSTGKTGKEICGQALERGLDVTAFARHPLDLSILMDHIRVIRGDVLDQERVRMALAGADAAICTIGSSLRERNKPIESLGTETILRAMREEQVARLVLVSAFGVGDSREMMTPTHEKLLTMILGPILDDKERQEILVTESELDWIIVRPVRLARGDATGVYRIGEHLAPSVDSKISRADVAHFVLNQLSSDEYVGRAVTIMY